MLSSLLQKVSDVSVIKRLSFAASFYPPSMPHYWETVADFGTSKSRHTLTAEEAQIFVENLEVIDSEAFLSDKGLCKEIISMSRPGSDVPLGIVLVSSKENCEICGSKLYLRADRASIVTIYDDHRGTTPATHFTKYCRKKGCSSQQHYGFSTRGESKEVTYDSDWLSLPFFMSSRETAFAIDILQRLDSEILIGQISYKQRADIYNAIH